MQPELLERLQVLAQTPHLLVACDYDGTLAEIVLTPAFAFPSTAAIKALRAAGKVAATTTAIVSGRSHHDLQCFLGEEIPQYLVGSHGAEWRLSGVILSAQQRALLDQVTAIIASIVAQGDGLSCELKPAGVTLHFRSAPRAIAQAAIAASLEQCAGLPGVNVRHGNEVVEFMVVDTTKAGAVGRITYVSGASAVLFIGDDPTDEEVFRTLPANSLAIRVGPGETEAHFRVSKVVEVAAVLQTLTSMRQEWAKRHQLSSTAGQEGTRP